MSAILVNARGGQQADELALMYKMQALRKNAVIPPMKRVRGRRAETPNAGDPDAAIFALMQDAGDEGIQTPNHQRALALLLLNAGAAGDAERELRRAIAAQPTHSPAWTELSMVLAAQGKNEEAVAALLVAQHWALDPAQQRQAVEMAAQSATLPAMKAVAGAALQALDAEAAKQKQLELDYPLQSPANGDAAKGTNAKVLFDGCSKPEWPRNSLRFSETGKVTLAFLVGEDGKLLRLKRLQSSGYSELDNAAMLGLSACKFAPPQPDGKPHAGWARLQYVWTLE